MRKPIIGALALLASVIVPVDAAHATAWKFIGQSNDGTKMWVDTDSIRRGKEYTGAWYRLGLNDNTWYTAFSAFNCTGRSFMILKMTAYSSSGVATSLDSRLKMQWDIANPESLMEGVVDAVCGSGW